MSIGENIRRCRRDLDMTLEEVATRVGVTRATIQKYENGIINNIPSDKIELLAKVLHTTPAYLMGWEAGDEEKPTVKDDGLSEIERLFLSLPPARREEVLRFMEYQASQSSAE